jgi:hypothetical protein
MILDTKLSEAWREGGAQLGIRVTAPFELTLPDGEVITVEVFLPDFGGPKGAVLLELTEEKNERASRARTAGVYVSQLGSDYRSFDEDLFRFTLDDWGWYGTAADQPSWYSGRA